MICLEVYTNRYFIAETTSEYCDEKTRTFVGTCYSSSSRSSSSSPSSPSSPGASTMEHVIADYTMINAMISHGKAWESNGQLSESHDGITSWNRYDTSRALFLATVVILGLVSCCNFKVGCLGKLPHEDAVPGGHCGLAPRRGARGSQRPARRSLNRRK